MTTELKEEATTALPPERREKMINIALPLETAARLDALADRNDRPTRREAARLIKEGLEREAKAERIRRMRRDAEARRDGRKEVPA